MKEKIVLLGGGGHGKVLIEALRLADRFEITGILDPYLKIGERVMGVPVLGDDERLPSLLEEDIRNAFVAITPLDYRVRVRLYNQLTIMGFTVPNILHPDALISSSALLANSGIFVAVQAVINPCARIGKGAVINTSVSVDHDCEIGEFVHLAPGVRLGGTVTIGDNSFIGMGTSVIQGLTIGRNCIIGAGSVVVKDIEDNVKAFGVPCRVVGKV